MASNSVEHKTRSRDATSCPLTRKLFDVSGKHLIPVHVIKREGDTAITSQKALRSDPKDLHQTVGDYRDRKLNT